MKKALICGVSGQDGAHLAELLLRKGYEVFGTSRDAEAARFDRSVCLGGGKCNDIHAAPVLPLRQPWLRPQHSGVQLVVPAANAIAAGAEARLSQGT